MLRTKLQDDQIQALKSGNKIKLTVLRYILSEIKNKEIEKNPPAGGELNNEECIVVLKKITKELKESIEAFKKGNRKDLMDEYQAQLNIVIPYLPKEISDEELQTAIKVLIEKNKKLYEQNPKAIIGVCMKELKAKADPSRILKLLNQITANG